ncbi:hypothetical protein HRG84_24225 [Flavisolibacter sp. BT320]|nr:hypothetical protein [Flavisolibacter longurius]
MATDFYGGMFIHLLSYWWIILPVLLFYVVSLYGIMISLHRQGIKQNKIKLVSHGAVITGILLFNLYDSELFKSDRVLTAILHDDQFHYTLVFRKDGKCENDISGIFGYHQEFKGQYVFKQDTIVFTKKPYDNDFIPDTLLIDRTAGVIFIEKDKTGFFVKEKNWLNHFEIQ